MIKFNGDGEGVSVTKLSPAAIKANTVNTKCPANDEFTGAPHECLAEQLRGDGSQVAYGRLRMAVALFTHSHVTASCFETFSAWRIADEQKRWYGMWAATGFAIGIVVAWIGSVCWCAFRFDAC